MSTVNKLGPIPDLLRGDHHPGEVSLGQQPGGSTGRHPPMMNSDAQCLYCLQEGQTVQLVFDPQALMLVCPSCGTVDPDASSNGYETLGRATEDESHLLGRALVNAQGRVVGSGQRGRHAAQAAAQARRDHSEADLELLIESVGCVRSSASFPRRPSRALLL